MRQWIDTMHRPLVRALVVAASGMASEALAVDDSGPTGPSAVIPIEVDDGDGDITVVLGTEYTRIGTERGARVAIEASLFDALELGLAAGYDEDRLRVGPGERRPDEREIELFAGWTMLEHDSGIALGLVVENAWTRADEGLLLQDQEELDEDEDGDEDGEGDDQTIESESAVERGAELHVGVVVQIDFSDHVVAGVELFRERVDGDGRAVSATGREFGIDVLLTPRLTAGASATRLRAADEATEYSLGLFWAASERILLGVQGSRRTAEPDLLTFGIELRLR